MNLPSFVYSSSKTKSFLSFFFFSPFGHAVWFAGSQIPKKDWTPAPAMQEPSPNHWTAREFQKTKSFLTSHPPHWVQWDATDCQSLKQQFKQYTIKKCYWSQLFRNSERYIDLPKRSIWFFRVDWYGDCCSYIRYGGWGRRWISRDRRGQRWLIRG